ncbi:MULTISPECIES: hypothetical protein [unclassified Methanosarcina]|nr:MULTISPECIES: hypothetical protein [unclassified Methanosarcina]
MWCWNMVLECGSGMWCWNVVLECKSGHFRVTNLNVFRIVDPE